MHNFSIKSCTSLSLSLATMAILQFNTLKAAAACIRISFFVFCFFKKKLRKVSRRWWVLLSCLDRGLIRFRMFQGGETRRKHRMQRSIRCNLLPHSHLRHQQREQHTCLQNWTSGIEEWEKSPKPWTLTSKNQETGYWDLDKREGPGPAHSLPY